MALAFVGVLGAVLLFLVRRGGEPAGETPGAQTKAPPPAGGARQGAPEAAPARPTDPAGVRRPIDLPRRERPAERAGREAEVRRAVEHVVAPHERIARVTSVSCDATSCRVEIETRDLGAFTPAYEEMQTGGLRHVATRIQLEQPVALGPDDTGPWRLAFKIY